MSSIDIGDVSPPGGKNAIPAWARDVLGANVPASGDAFEANGRMLVNDGGILRSSEMMASARQEQTASVFGFKWHKRETFDDSLTKFLRNWLFEKYGDVANAKWLGQYGAHPLLLDLGCGACMSALELWAEALPRLRFIGADISNSVDVARDRFRERGFEGLFIQADLHQVPVRPASVDVIFSEGVLHHSDDTRTALAAAVSYLKPGGRILFYVYKKKGPIREFTDDYVRGKMQDLTPEQAWQAMLPFTKLGVELGKLDINIDVPEAIDLLQIPAGRINLQRLFYWHIFKAWYAPGTSLEEMNHINFDWYAPRNAHRQTPEDVRTWCGALGLKIEHERIEDAGITIIAKKL